jgi:hypothetical protein
VLGFVDMLGLYKEFPGSHAIFMNLTSASSLQQQYFPSTKATTSHPTFIQTMPVKKEQRKEFQSFISFVIWKVSH